MLEGSILLDNWRQIGEKLSGLKEKIWLLELNDFSVLLRKILASNFRECIFSVKMRLKSIFRNMINSAQLKHIIAIFS